MAISLLATAVRNAAADAYVDQIDTGTTNANGKVRIYTAGDVLLAEFDCANPAFGNAGATVNGRADAASLPYTDTAVADGTASYYEVLDRDENVLWRGAVGADLTLSNTSITTGDTVNITAWTHTHPTG